MKNSQNAIEEWLQNFGFYFNPFRYTDAERDQYLSSYFFEHPDFEAIAQPGDQLVFARAGDGKTVLRLRLQSLYREELPRRKVFCFSYTIPLTVAENPPCDLLHHMQHILIASVRHAFVLLAAQGSDLIEMEQDAGLAAEFAAFFDRYLGTSLWLEDLRDGLEANSIDPIVQNLRSTFDDLALPSGWLTVNGLWLRRWIDLLQSTARPLGHADDSMVQWQVWQGLLRRAGFRASLMLVDGIDVKPSERSEFGGQDPAGMMRRLAAPLVQALQEKQFGEDCSVKLFLPIELFHLLSDILRRNDPATIIHWNREQLRQMLALRLQAATYGAITDFAQIVEPDVHPQIGEWLLTLAGSSPRRLLHAVEQILRVQASTSQSGELPGKISRRTLAQLPFHRLNLFEP